MSTQPDFLFQLLQALDGLISLGIALWIINIGINRFDKMQETSDKREDTILERHESLTKTALEESAARNDQLMSLVSTLCAQSVQRSGGGSPLSSTSGAKT